MINWNGLPHWRIVGVVGSVRIDKPWEEPVPILYIPMQQAQRRARYFVIRSSLPTQKILTSAREALHRVDPTIAVTDAASMEQRVDTSLGPQRFRAVLMVALGGLALGLAVIGIYSVIAYAVARRTREIGIRMALGEAASHVRWRVIGDALGVAGVGMVGGVALSLLAGRWLTVFLVDVSPFDLRLLLSAAGALFLVVATAAHGPARRAARVDPVGALRAD
jgi:ABC-type antimicrobial peptide transport system permease subunit